MHTHRTVMATLVGGLAWNPGGLGQASLTVLPLFHVTGMQNSMNGPIYFGETMVIMSRWDRRVAAELIRRYRIARWRSIATMAIDLVNDPDLARYDLSSLKMIGGGGASMPDAVARRFKEITGLDYIEGYGMSETMAATHINPADKPRRQCLGIPVFGVDSRVVDPDTLKELGPDEPGEIVVAGPQVFIGYWNNPEATRAAFIEIDGKRFLRTGDIGRYDAQGYFYMVDRVKRMVNAAGFKVWPTEVEGMIHDHPAVAEVCVVGYPDPRRGESVLAYVVARESLAEADLIAWCHDQMAAYKCPRKIVFLEALPRSPSGKVQWRSLQEQAARDFGDG
jgi:fatty-acyl-CoA synthase